MTIYPAATAQKTSSGEKKTGSTGSTASDGGFSSALSQAEDKEKAKQQQELRQTCQQLESFMIQQMLESMNRTVQESNFLPKSAGHDIWQSMLTEQYSTAMSERGSLGLADMLYKQLSQEEGLSTTDTSASSSSTKVTPSNRRSTLNRSSSKKTVEHSNSGNRRSYSGSGDISAIVNAVARKYNLSSRLINAVIQAESDFDPSSLSPTGAAGLMQLMPGTAASLGVDDVWDPQQNVDGGCRYLRQMLDRYHGDISLALAAYNAGPGSVDKYGGIPPYAETQAYVRKILSSYTGR